MYRLILRRLLFAWQDSTPRFVLLSEQGNENKSLPRVEPIIVKFIVRYDAAAPRLLYIHLHIVTNVNYTQEETW